MADVERGLAHYRPSKTLWAWSLVGAAALTMMVGFTWGGWTTTGCARVMTDMTVRDARADLVAGICVQNFVTASDAADNLKALQAKSSWQLTISSRKAAGPRSQELTTRSPTRRTHAPTSS